MKKELQRWVIGVLIALTLYYVIDIFIKDDYVRGFSTGIMIPYIIQLTKIIIK